MIGLMVPERRGNRTIYRIDIDRLREGQVLFTYLHLAANKDLTQALLDRGDPAKSARRLCLTSEFPSLLSF